jgi:hypothetical protein
MASDTFYTDSTVLPGVTYFYCVTARIKADAESRLSNEASGMVGVAESSSDRMGLLSISPNPFRTQTYIKIGLRVPSGGSGASFQDFQTEGLGLSIYDAAGRIVNSFALRNTSYAIHWGQSVPDGIYFAGIKTPSGWEIKKIIKTQ